MLPRIGRVAVVVAAVLLALLLALNKVAHDVMVNPIARNEANSVRSIREIRAALGEYWKKHNAFPDRISALRDSLDSQLACDEPACVKNNFKFTYRRLPPDAAGEHYALLARPTTFGQTGVRSLFCDERDPIRFTSEDREATVKDPPLM